MSLTVANLKNSVEKQNDSWAVTVFESSVSDSRRFPNFSAASVAGFCNMFACPAPTTEAMPLV